MRAWTSIVLVVLLACCWCGAGAGERPVALLTSIAGSVQVDRAPGRLLQSLPPGTRVQVGSGGRATLSYVSGGVRVHLDGPCAVTIQAQGYPSGTGVSVVRPENRNTALLPAGVNIDQMGGARAHPPLRLHVGGMMDDVSRLQWRTTQGYAEFKTVVARVRGEAIYEFVSPAIPTRNVPDTIGNVWSVYEAPLPTSVIEKLRAGEEYEVRITASDTAGAAGTTYVSRFRLIDPALAARLAARRAQVDGEYSDRDFFPFVELAGIYLSNQMVFPAYHLLEQIGSRPDCVLQTLARIERMMPIQNVKP